MIPNLYAPLPSFRVVCQSGDPECYLTHGLVYRSFPEAFSLQAAHAARYGHEAIVETTDEAPNA